MRKKARRLSGEAGRELIIQATLGLIARNGWSGLSFQLVARRCRMSKSNIVYHFQSRESLLLALLGHISANNWRLVTEGVKPNDNAEQRLKNHIVKNLEWARDFPAQAQVILQIYAEAAHDPNFTEIFKSMIERAESRILEHLFAGQREGLFHFSDSPESTARHLHSLLVGTFIKQMGDQLGKSATVANPDLSVMIDWITRRL